MSQIETKSRFFKATTLAIVGILLLVFSAVLLLWYGNTTSMQAAPALVAGVYFDGEYRIADGEWQKIVKGEHISSTEGDVTLRGNFHMLAPDGEYIGIYSDSIPIALYTNHIKREKELRFSANRDSLTGLRNTRSYKSWVAEFDKEIENKTANFGVVVFDLNKLKETNDTYGHDVGDKLIIAAAKAISDVFKRSPVFRIGGDEFLAVLRHRDLEDHEELFVRLDAVCENTIIEENDKTYISIARGFAMFEVGKDFCFNDVFKRADNAMYENKRKNKVVNEEHVI